MNRVRSIPAGRARLSSLATLGLLLLQPLACHAVAQEAFPGKPVTLVVPFAAGGSTDLLARTLAERLAATWRQPVQVENRSGMSGLAGSEAVARARPDGYTLLIGTATTHAVAQTLYPRLPYDVLRDFQPVAELVTIPQLLSVHPSLPVRSLQELVAYAKARPGHLSYGAGAGAAANMAMELLAARAGIRLQRIPYKGSGPAMADLLTSQLPVGIDVIMTTLPHLQAGRLRSLAVSSARRSPLAPQVPTVAESGFPGFEASVWFGLFAPAGTPRRVVEKISEDSRRVLLEPAMRERLESGGFEIVASSPAVFSVRVKDEVGRWRKVIRDGGIKLDE